MNDEPVILRIVNLLCPGRRSVDLRMPRWRAEAIVSMFLGCPYEFELIPVKDSPVKWLGYLEASLRGLKSAKDWAGSHKSEIGAVAAWVAAAPLPSPYSQWFHLLSATLAFFAGTKYGS